MTPGRREFLMVGGGVIATLGFPRVTLAGPVETIEMRGTARGGHVWFAPVGLAVAPGTTVRFVNRDSGNSHTATAYHPDIFDRQRRIPEQAVAWDSDFLLPGESFEVTLTVPGVYDYYCLPHEMAGMVGRILVGQPTDQGWDGAAGDSDDLEPGVDKTWGSCGAFSVCDGQPTIENCGPCDGYSVSPFGRPPHPSALSHAGIGNVID